MVKIEGVALYLAELNGVPVATGMTAISGDLTGIFNVSALPQYRPRGYGRVVTLEMIRVGLTAGAPTAYLYSPAWASASTKRSASTPRSTGR